PNTGGMGAYAPAPVATPEALAEIKERIVMPVIKELAKRGTPYRGILYAGLMITPPGGRLALSGSRINVVEFNARFGDPETEAVLPLIGGDFAGALLAAATGTLRPELVSVSPGAAATVVLASGGYPRKYEKGKRISGLDEAAKTGATVFHCGTKRGDDGSLLTSGGRVLSVTGLGDTLETAVAKAYEAAGRISFDGMFFRKDIAAKAFAGKA
ncbi:MAG: phosphoribosylamine--glycine ligase, partial [Kiritimatiellae bacterium]|nr:phosphoribosylamine--glycine ligase [Kiritimatiellia bacterium]